MKSFRSLLLLFSVLVSFAATAQKNWAVNDTTTSVGPNTRIDFRFDVNGRPYVKRGGTGSQGYAVPLATKADVVAAAGGGVQTVNSKTPSSGNVNVTASDVGLGNVNNTSDVNKPISSAAQTALNGKEPTIATGSTGQYIRGDKSLATLDKSAVGLANVDNTADASKPISTATQTALNGKEATLPTGSTAQYLRGDKTLATLDKSAVGLANADNTSDVNKPISTATQAVLDTKAAVINSVFKVNVATYAALTSLTVPAGLSYIVKVAADESQVAPYTTNQYYFKDDSGLTFKILLDKQ